MDVIVIDRKIWQALNEKIDNLERLLIEIKHQPKAPECRTQGEFTTVEDVIKKYKISRTTINKKAKKYKIERLKSGRQNLINEQQFIESLKYPEPKPDYFLKKPKV